MQNTHLPLLGFRKVKKWKAYHSVLLNLARIFISQFISSAFLFFKSAEPIKTVLATILCNCLRDLGTESCVGVCVLEVN